MEAIQTSWSDAAKGNARISTALTTENTAVVAPIVSASVHTTVTAKPRWRRCWRSPTRKSFKQRPFRHRKERSADDLRQRSAEVGQPPPPRLRRDKLRLRQGYTSLANAAVGRDSE